MLAIAEGRAIVSPIDGELLCTIGIQISQMDARSKDAEEKKRSNRFFG